MTIRVQPVGKVKSEAARVRNYALVEHLGMQGPTVVIAYAAWPEQALTDVASILRQKAELYGLRDVRWFAPFDVADDVFYGGVGYRE